jgi:phosphotransferase system IIA component
MKLFNEIQAEISGEIVEILVEDGQMVEYGQPLFNCDFTTICDKYFFHYFTLNNGWPYSTICPSSTNISHQKKVLTYKLEIKSQMTQLFVF